MKIYKNMRTARAKQIVAMGTREVGYNLTDCYSSHSNAKQNAFERCFEEYRNDLNSKNFSICSYNTFGFTCSWFFDYLDPKTGEITEALRVETPKNSYIVLLVD